VLGDRRRIGRATALILKQLPGNQVPPFGSKNTALGRAESFRANLLLIFDFLFWLCKFKMAIIR
jgi:hypothetical protein